MTGQAGPAQASDPPPAHHPRHESAFQQRPLEPHFREVA
jgi:hypothetical protein